MSQMNHHDLATLGVTAIALPPAGAAPRPLHQLREVRLRQRVSRRTMALRLNSDMQDVDRQEDENTDIPLSTLYRWKEALDVPVTELLIGEDDGLEPALSRRSQMVRLMKTARSIMEQSNQGCIRRLTQNLINLLLEMMPELKDVTAWPLVGKRQSLEQLRAASLRLFVPTANLAHHDR